LGRFLAKTAIPTSRLSQAACSGNSISSLMTIR
jgi:hypothetical protein